MRPIRRILVAVKDPTAKTLPAVDKAAQLARAFSARLELFHAISTPLYVDAYSPALSIAQIERATRHDTLEQLEKVTMSRRDGPTIEVDVELPVEVPTLEHTLRAAPTGAVRNRLPPA